MRMKLINTLKKPMPKPEQNTKKRNKLSDSQLKTEIIAVFNSGISGKMEVFGTIRNKFTCARDRFTEMYNTCYSEWSKIKEQASSDATVQAADKAAKIGLKSKLQKQIELQNEVDYIDKQIRGEVKFTFVVGNKVMKSHNMDNGTEIFMLPVQVQNNLRAQKLQYMAELNKMDGDYAPTKVAQTNKDGEDLPQYDLSKLSDAELRLIAEIQSKGRVSEA